MPYFCIAGAACRSVTFSAGVACRCVIIAAGRCVTVTAAVDCCCVIHAAAVVCLLCDFRLLVLSPAVFSFCSAGCSVVA